jgi:hypothetical protein
MRIWPPPKKQPFNAQHIISPAAIETKPSIGESRTRNETLALTRLKTWISYQFSQYGICPLNQRFHNIRQPELIGA